MITSISFVAQWSEPSSDPVCGPVQYIVTVSTGGMVITNVTVNRTNYTVRKLCSNTVYEINVTAISNAGSGHPVTVNVATMNTGKYNCKIWYYCTYLYYLKIYSMLLVYIYE